jgi:hypothetical protein
MYLDIINQTFASIGKVPFSSLSVPYVSYHASISGRVAQYEMQAVFNDYHGETASQNAFIAMLEKSECPLVKAYKETVQACFVAQNLEELEVFTEESK